MALIAFIVALGCGLLLTPLVRRASLELGFVARPREDRWHSRPTAVLGGVGIFLAFTTSLVVRAFFLREAAPVPWGMLAGSGIVFLLGLYDDLKHITPPAKLVGQILAAAVVISLGYTTNFFTPRIPDNIVAQLPNILLTFIWLVGITNAINLLDNMDGLAGGISLITALFLSYFFWRAGNPGLLYISIALAGAVLAFLVFNFPPASLFMGDSGSLFLGFTLAVLAIARQPQASNVFAVMGVPTLLFLLPILDTALVTFTRLLRGQSPAQGGRDHTSHRLIAFGLNERQAVLVLYGVAVVSGALAAAVESLRYWLSLVLVPILVISLALVVAYLGGLKVVSADPSPRQEKAITRIMLELTFRRRLFEIILDFFLIGVTYYLAFLVRFGFTMNAVILERYLLSLPVALASTYLSLYVFGIYRGVWRYVGLDDLVRFFQATIGAVVMLTAALLLMYSTDQYSPVIFLLYAVFLLLGLAASRSSFRLMDLASRRQYQPVGERILICGAGDQGEMALRWILMNPQLRYRTLGFLDADPYMKGRHIHGVQVLGGLDTLETVLDQGQIDGMILAGSSAGEDGFSQAVMDACRSHGCWVRSLRLEFEPVNERWYRTNEQNESEHYDV